MVVLIVIVIVLLLLLLLLGLRYYCYWDCVIMCSYCNRDCVITVIIVMGIALLLLFGIVLVFVNIAIIFNTGIGSVLSLIVLVGLCCYLVLLLWLLLGVRYYC